MLKKQILFIAIAVFTFTSSCFSQNIVEWRGPNRTGIYNETGLLKEWPAEGPKLLWSYDELPRLP